MLMRMPQTQSCVPNTQFEDAHFCRQSNAATAAAQTNATTTCAATATGCDWHLQPTVPPTSSQHWAIRARLTIRSARALLPTTQRLISPCPHYSAQRSHHPGTCHAPHALLGPEHAHAQAAPEPLPKECPWHHSVPHSLSAELQAE